MAAVDYFLKIDGIDGESPDHKHKGEIQLESWSFGESQGGTHSSGGGGGAGKVQMQDFHFVMKISKASPKLFLACACGQQEFLKTTFTDILVSSYQTGGSGHSDIVPTDQISLNFAKIEIEYKEQKPDGTLGGAVKAGYDLKLNKAV
mgnify:CR=1 FL=1